MRKDFCAFIMSYQRPDNVITYRLLRSSGYSGKIYVVVGDDDKCLDRYKSVFGDELLIFSKTSVAQDIADNFSGKCSIFFARNACFDLAESVGCDWFIELDDDYKCFGYRFDDTGKYVFKGIKKIDSVFDAMIRFMSCSDKILSVAMMQGGDYIGGKNSGAAEKIYLKRKAMNSFVCSTKRRFDFIGRINEDVNTYVSYGLRGGLFFSTSQVSLGQKQTQKQTGGLTDLYSATGTYVKSFYTVMIAPACVRIGLMGYVEQRIHHRVKWNNATPCIVMERYRKNEKEKSA